ncbi:hypothetical protein EZV62_024537 [Acer yangbiense]|uniref:BED-type domain-containing protein n=1 Tax=Acer yangbiense TaxID=1000413 RepID=A0A5C7GWF5_9ROSI|nr:hypothetical protein EZV62_024537 [Acer yangbiense]
MSTSDVPRISSDSIATPSANEPNSVEIENDQAPLWKYVTKLERVGKGGGNISYRCNFCQTIYKGSYYRVKSHLLKIKGCGVASCPKVTNANLLEMQQIVEEAELRVKQSLPRSVTLPTTIGSSSASASNLFGLDPKKRKGVSGAIERAFNMGAREQLDGEIARMFYTGGLSFHFARNPHYVNAFKSACSNPIPGYLPPGYNSLRTTLLQKEKANLVRLLDPIKAAWEIKGVSVCSDGWSDSQRRPLINIMAVSRLLVEAKFPHIFWTPCVVHTLNLALKNICSPSSHPKYDDVMEVCGWIPKVSSDAWFIKNFIMNHSMRLAMFNDHSKLKLLTVADTRFASTIVMLKRFKEIKQALQHMVISEKWDMYKEDDVEKARAVKEKLLNELFWLDIDYILDFTALIYEMVRITDTDKPCLHLVYEWWDSMIEKVKIAIFTKERRQLEDASRFFDVVHGILVDRWTKSSTPLHCLAHSLNLRYYSKQWLQEVPGRVPPHQDFEITRERKKCIERYFPNVTERRKVNEEFANFSMFLEDFAGSDSMDDRSFMPPEKWWGIHGSSIKTLQNIAFKLLWQPCSSSCCERNLSTYNFIHSMRRNKITPQRAEDLVFVHTSLRLLSRRSPTYNEGMKFHLRANIVALPIQESTMKNRLSNLLQGCSQNLKAILEFDDGTFLFHSH